MKQLTVGELLDFCDIIKTKRSDISLEEFREMPVYIGGKEVCCACETMLVDADYKDPGSMHIVEKINNNFNNPKMENGKAILIY